MRKIARDNFKPDSVYEPQLILSEMVLPSGGEWTPQLRGWLFVHVSAGVGYWMHERNNQELHPGAVVLYSDQIKGCIRSSQVAEMRLHFFRTEPTKLTGLATMADQQLLHNAAGDKKLSSRVLQPNSLFSEKLKKLSAKEAGNNFLTRAQLLLLFLEAFGGNFDKPQVEASGSSDAGARLRQLLNKIPISELIETNFNDLVAQTGCSSRHVSRLFTELVGVSFREKQAELRMARACELLATTDFKIVDVALQSGYQSTSLFNFIFKQRIGVSPGKWRGQVKTRRPAKESVRRMSVAGRLR